MTLIVGSLSLGLVAGWAVGAGARVSAWASLLGAALAALSAVPAGGEGAVVPSVRGVVVGVGPHRLFRAAVIPRTASSEEGRQA